MLVRELVWRTVYTMVGGVLSWGVVYHGSATLWSLGVLMMGRRFQLVDLQEGFLATLHLTTLLTTVVTLPLLCYHLWAWIRPGLYRGEARTLGQGARGMGLWVCVHLLMAVWVVPSLGTLFLSFQVPGLMTYVPRAGSLVTLVSDLLPWLFLVTHTPLLVAFLHPPRWSGYGVVVMLVAVVSPPDVVVQSLSTMTLFFLWEVGVWMGCVLRRRSSFIVSRGAP